MAKLDKELARKLMQAGDTDSKIATVFGTSRQAVNLLRQSLVADGKLAAASATKQERPSLNATRPTEQPEATPHPGTSPQEPSPATHPTLDQLTDWMIQIIKEAGETHRLRQESNSAQAKIKALQAEIEKLEEALRLLTDKQTPGLQKASEFQAAVEHTDLPALRGPNLTDQSS